MTSERAQRNRDRKGAEQVRDATGSNYFAFEIGAIMACSLSKL